MDNQWRMFQARSSLTNRHCFLTHYDNSSIERVHKINILITSILQWINISITSILSIISELRGLFWQELFLALPHHILPIQYWENASSCCFLTSAHVLHYLKASFNTTSHESFQFMCQTPKLSKQSLLSNYHFSEHRFTWNLQNQASSLFFSFISSF